MSPLEKSAPVELSPDKDFLRTLSTSVGDAYKQCCQCGTCSATCSISPSTSPFPRKEMAKAAFGMKEDLICSPDVWLCHQCNDCSLSCPRGARPGDVLSTARTQSIYHFAFPRFLAGWVNSYRFLPILLTIPAALLGLAVLFREKLATVLNIDSSLGKKIVFSHSPFLPHWLLNCFFSFFSILTILVMLIGVIRFWRSMKSYALAHNNYHVARSFSSSIVFTIKRILTHDQFASCDATHSRFMSHFCVSFGFITLSFVTSWVISSGCNPIVNAPFVYPFQFSSLWKILANLGGVALFSGCLMMILDRLKNFSSSGKGTYFDWFFLLLLFAVVISGFATEALHYLRLEPHRHVMYFLHLSLVFVFLMNLPYSKFAHFVYRTVAIVFSARIGRDMEVKGIETLPLKGCRHVE